MTTVSLTLQDLIDTKRRLEATVPPPHVPVLIRASAFVPSGDIIELRHADGVLYLVSPEVLERIRRSEDFAGCFREATDDDLLRFGL